MLKTFQHLLHSNIVAFWFATPLTEVGSKFHFVNGRRRKKMEEVVRRNEEDGRRRKEMEEE